MLQTPAPHLELEEYRALFSDQFQIERDDQGIVEVSPKPTGGDPVAGALQAPDWAALLHAVAADPKNQVLIVSTRATSPHPGITDAEFSAQSRELKTAQPAAFSRALHAANQQASRTMAAMAFAVGIPTVGVIRGDSCGQATVPLLCDVTLCSMQVRFRFEAQPASLAPNDGFFTAMQRLIGPMRANHLAMTGATFGAEEAKAWGAVTELVDDEQIMERAHALACGLLQQSKAARDMTHDLMVRPLRSFVGDAFNYPDLAGTFASLCTTDA